MFTFTELENNTFELKTKEDVLLAKKIVDNIEENIKEKVIDAAAFLGIIDNTWHYEDFSIGENRIYVTTYDYYYDLHDTKHDSFPIECILSKDYLETYKKECEEAQIRYQEQQKQEKLQKEMETELAELARLKAKYEETEPDLEK